MTETALILLLKISEIPKSYIYTLQIPYPRRLSHKGNNSNSLSYSSKTLSLAHCFISAISQITATTTSQNNIVNINHTNMCKGNYKQLTRKIHYNNKLIKNLEYKTPNISCFGMCA